MSYILDQIIDGGYAKHASPSKLSKAEKILRKGKKQIERKAKRIAEKAQSTGRRIKENLKPHDPNRGTRGPRRRKVTGRASFRKDNILEKTYDHTVDKGRKAVNKAKETGAKGRDYVTKNKDGILTGLVSGGVAGGAAGTVSGSKKEASFDDFVEAFTDLHFMKEAQELLPYVEEALIDEYGIANVKYAAAEYGEDEVIAELEEEAIEKVAAAIADDYDDVFEKVAAELDTLSDEEIYDLAYELGL